MNVKLEHVAVGAGIVVAGLFLYGGLRGAGGLPLPAAPVTEPLYTVPDPIAVMYLQNPTLNSGMEVYTHHRYPDRVGGEITTAIHYGHSRLAVPDERDSNWITCPPSEVTI